MGQLFSAINALFLGAIAFAGLVFNLEQRRMDNYQALYELIESNSFDDWRDDQEAIDAFSNSANCAPLSEDPASQGFASRIGGFRCPLTDQHRFILNRLITEKRGFVVAQLEAPAAGPSEPVQERRALQLRRRPGPLPQISATQRRSLVSDINSASRDIRRAATAQLEADGLRDADVVADLVEQLADVDKLDALNAQGRFNVIYLLNQTPDDVWTQAMLARARVAIDQIQERTRSGRSAMGDQTRQALAELDAKITRLGG